MNFSKFIIAPLLLAFFASCSNSNQAEKVEGEEENDTIISNAIQSIKERKGTIEHKLGGKKYICTFKLASDTTLKVVTNPMDYQYYDNKVTLEIKSDGKSVLNASFTKNYFKEGIPEKFFKTSGLIGFTYNYDKENDPSGIHFIATIGDPDESSDISCAFDIKITANGQISYEKLKDRDMMPIGQGMTIDPPEEHD